MIARALQYADLGYCVVSVGITWNPDTNKKVLAFQPSWPNAGLPTTDAHPFIQSSCNGLAIVTGKASDVLAIDCDKKPYSDGLAHFNHLAQTKGLPDNTPMALTGSGTRHYLFSLSKSIAEGLSPDVKGKADLVLGGTQAAIDSRINNNCIICEPSAYPHPDGTRTYKWITPLQHSRDLPAAPAWLIQDLNVQPKRKMDTNTNICLKRSKTADANALLVPSDRFAFCKPLLTEIGFLDPRLTRLKDQGFDFVVDRTNCCACCQLHHDTNVSCQTTKYARQKYMLTTDLSNAVQEWYSREIFQGIFDVKSYSQRCRSRIVGFEAQRKIQAICSSPLSDAPYADVFAIQFGLTTSTNPIIWTGARWLYFETHRWKPVLPEDVRKLMQTSLLTLLEQLLRWSKSSEVDVRLVGGGKADIVQAQQRSETLMKAISHVRKSNTARNIIDALHSDMMKNVGEHPSGIAGDVTLDGDPLLLGCDNGVIDLTTGKLRAGRTTDWVSKTVGYEFLPDPEGDAFVEETMAQILPVAEEREYFQRYSGYCLLGSHAEKHYLLVTDMPGKRSSNNGKTTLSHMLRAAMGEEYSCVGIDASLYTGSTANESENQCCPGRLHYRGMRLSTFEELDPKRRLNTTRLKNLHGGSAVDTARAAYGKSVESYDWTAKFLITFNIANQPDINYEDSVHLDRMLFLRGRAKFLDATEYDELVDSGTLPPDTHKKNPHFKDRLQRHRSSILRWMLQGLMRYWELRLGQAPPIMAQWRREIAGQQDLVKEWVEQALTRTGDKTDFVKRSELYQSFKGATEEERDKKTALGKQKFFHKLLLELGEENFKARHQQDRQQFKDVFLHWTIATSAD